MNTARTEFPLRGNAVVHPGPKEPLQIRLPARIKREFKALAALRGIDPNELFVEVWQHYERTNPSGVISSSGK